MSNTKKITLATVKSFIKKNLKNLHIEVEGRFDGMFDCVTYSDNPQIRKADVSGFNPKVDYNMGIPGVWFVRGSRDYFTPISKNGMVGYHVYNCCGSWNVLVPEEK
jgi:hypothetical protein